MGTTRFLSSGSRASWVVATSVSPGLVRSHTRIVDHFASRIVREANLRHRRRAGRGDMRFNSFVIIIILEWFAGHAAHADYTKEVCSAATGGGWACETVCVSCGEAPSIPDNAVCDRWETPSQSSDGWALCAEAAGTCDRFGQCQCSDGACETVPGTGMGPHGGYGGPGSGEGPSVVGRYLWYPDCWDTCDSECQSVGAATGYLYPTEGHVYSSPMTCEGAPADGEACWCGYDVPAVRRGHGY